MTRESHGIVACFENSHAFIEALRELRQAGYTHIEANVPFGVEEMSDLLPGKPTPIARIVLAGGIVGGCAGYFLQWFAAHDYPLNVGGRPLNSWPAFVPVTFELTVLTAVLAGVLGLLWLCGLPRLDHPIFNASGIERATQDRFFLCVKTDDPKFDANEVSALFARLKPETCEEVFA